MTLTTETGTAGGTSTRRWDDRGFYRTALAVVAPLPMLAMGTIYLLTDMPGTGPFHDMLAAATRQEGMLNAMSWVQLLFFAFLVPAVIAVAAVTRARSPRLTAVGVVLTVPGLALGCSNGSGDTGLALITVQKHLDVSSMTELDQEMQKLATNGVSSLLFIIGIVIGLLLLGIALARSGAVSLWFGVALAVGGFAHPFVPTHVLTGIGLYIAAIGFAGASLGLLRMRNDQFAPSASLADSADE